MNMTYIGQFGALGFGFVRSESTSTPAVRLSSERWALSRVPPDFGSLGLGFRV